jgi:hypothetical protein
MGFGVLQGGVGGVGSIGGVGGIGRVGGGYGGRLSGGGYGGAAGGAGYEGGSTGEGYGSLLLGAADLTRANAEYQALIQQAKLTRQEAIRSSFLTRRAAIEEYEYERGHWPDPEKIRQAELSRERYRARNGPPLTDVCSGHALNVLLRDLIDLQGRGTLGANVPLAKDTLKSINLTAGDIRGDVGLLTDKGPLQWPLPLQGEGFKEAREDLERRLKEAVDAASIGHKTPDPGILNDLNADWKKLSDALDASASKFSPGEYIEARRYLKLVDNTVTALRGRNASSYFNGSWTAKGRNVSELVSFMADKGLWFAAAKPGDERAYQALYRAMAAFDASIPDTNDAGGHDK